MIMGIYYEHLPFYTNELIVHLLTYFNIFLFL